MNPLNASQSTVCGLAWKRYSRQTPLRDVAPALNGRAALPGCIHAERALQASWWQEHGAAHAGGPRAQQAGKLETRALFAGSQGRTVAPAGGNTCAPLSAHIGSLVGNRTLSRHRRMTESNPNRPSEVFTRLAYRP